MSKFKWPAYPKSDTEFDALMVAIDNALAAEGLTPPQRPLNVGRKLWEAFGWGGSVFPPDELADLAGFEGDVLKAKTLRWYDDYYGKKLHLDRAYGYAPARLSNAMWSVRAAVTYGQVWLFADRNLDNSGLHLAVRGQVASYNVLCAIEGLTQGLANRLSDQMLREHLDFHRFIHENLQWRDSLPTTDLFNMARADYDESTAGILARRFGQARWAAQQAVEKTLKGLLSISNTPYPTSGSNGHNLKYLGNLFKVHHEIAISPILLELTRCSPKVRYGEEKSTEEEALQANHAAIGVFEQLRTNPKTAGLLAYVS